MLNWLKERCREMRGNAMWTGVWLVICAVFSAIKPTLARIWNQPFQWNVNGVWALVAILLFAVAIVQFSRAISAKKKNNGLMEPVNQAPEVDLDALRLVLQPDVYSVIDQLKTLAREGESMLGKYSLTNAENPTRDEVENYLQRTLDAAKNSLLREEGVTARQVALLQESWDAEETLTKKAQLIDLGTLNPYTSVSLDSINFDRLYSRVQRMWELLQQIEGVDSRPRLRL